MASITRQYQLKEPSGVMSNCPSLSLDSAPADGDATPIVKTITWDENDQPSGDMDLIQAANGWYPVPV